MKIIFLIPIFFLSLISTHCLGETMDELVKRNGLYYKKHNDTLFTGRVIGKEQGEIKNGKKEGEWVRYWRNGRPMSKIDFKNGKKEGEWAIYYSDGRLREKGRYKNGEMQGEWDD
tara:strand:+ start:1942 stop:2286 length:345 start_codon:yes stop_codon:yes gene_type:complete